LQLPRGKPSIREFENRDGCYPEDPEYSKLWGMDSIRAPQAWCYSQTSDVVVAVIDTGIDLNHPDLMANMWLNSNEKYGNDIDDDRNDIVDDIYGVDFTGSRPSANPNDGYGHGTHVSGTIGAVGNNLVGVVGVNWRVQLMALKVFDNDGKVGPGRTTALADAIFYARKNGAKVINLSLAWGTDVEIIGEQIDGAEKEGIMIVCSAGNARQDNDVTPQFPAAYKNSNIVSVASVNINDQLSGFSNFGSKSVHIAAPGEDIFSTYPTDKDSYHSASGTSMAAPHVSGAVALVWGQDQYKNLPHRDVKKMLIDKARPLASLSDKCVAQGSLSIAFMNPDPPKDREGVPPTKKDPVPPPAPPIEKTLPPKEKIVTPPVYIVCPPPVVYYPCPPHPPRHYRMKCGKH
jgi:serine protease